jgi:hypothetical protein
VAYAFNPDMLPDAHFHPGHLKYLVPGNEGRCLDPRRTPLRVLEIKRNSGFFVVELLDFEDKGRLWELPLEGVARCQFALASVEASGEDVAAYQEIISRLDHPVEIPADPAARARADEELNRRRREAGAWLEQHSRFLRSGRQPDVTGTVSHPDLWADLERYMTEVGLWDMEAAFAEQYVRNAESGELVKGHAIVLAEPLGLVPFHGKQVRDPELFAGSWSKDRRAGHILHRLAFVRALFHRLGLSSAVLYRGWSSGGVLQSSRQRSFVSATFSCDIAMSHFNDRDPTSTGVLQRQSVPVERLFMTCLETAHMNRQFKEAEAVLLGGGEDAVF